MSEAQRLPPRALLSLCVSGRCNLSCTVCDCREAPAERDAQGLPPLVRAGGERLVLRSEPALDPHFEALLRGAREAGWRTILVRTNGLAVHEPSVPARWRSWGATGVLVPLFSHSSAVHDRVAGRSGALVAAVRALHASAEAGLTAQVEIPLLPPRLQQVAEVLRLAAKVVPGQGVPRFYLPEHAQPEVLTPPPWPALRESLEPALGALEELHLALTLRAGDGLPLCALGHDERWQTRYRFDPRKAERPRAGYVHPAPCEGCAMRRHCAGVPEWYAKRHGAQAVQPFERRPRMLVSQRTTAPRQWTQEQRDAARHAHMLVLRPTIDCNQDCYFCSANETSAEVHEDPREMLGRIARAAQRGVVWLSFSGGEPTLSKHLVDYVSAAKRLGMDTIELVTNAVLLDNEERRKKLLDAGANTFFISLHAHDEALSQHLTAKVGDWERTTRAIDALVEAGVAVTLNHVITGRNYWYIPRFAKLVVERWGPKVDLSFAFVTPQYKALDDPKLVPRITDVWPYLRRGLWTLVQGKVPFIVGSRQGIPPCLLGEFEGFTDAGKLSNNARAEDAHQKVQGPECDRCRYARVCTGLWRSYAMRYGTGELRPILTDPALRDDEVARLSAPVKMATFESLPDFARHRDQEHPPEEALAEPQVRRMLPVFRAEAPEPSGGTSTLVFLGSGARATVLERALSQARRVRLEAVASPHLLDREAGPFERYARYDDASAALRAHPEASAVVLAVTPAHAPLTRLALGLERFVLLEKAPGRTVEEALALAREPGASRVMMAHNLLFAAGLAALRQARSAGEVGLLERVRVRRAMPQGLPEAPRTWSRAGLFELLYHLVVLSAEGSGSCAAEVRSVRPAGDGVFERLEATLRAGALTVELDLDARATADELSLELQDNAGRKLQWRRAGPSESLVRTTANGARQLSVQGGSELGRMLDAFAAFAQGGPRPAHCALEDGAAVMRTVQGVLDALGERVSRPEAPRHAASPALRQR